jgi:hypothetical protein
MAWSDEVVKSYVAMFGEPVNIHTGELADVAEFQLDDGTAVYGTAGLSTGGGWSAAELVMHVSSPDDRLRGVFSGLRGNRTIAVGGTRALDGDAPFDAVGFLYSGRTIHVQDARVLLDQLVGLTADEHRAARRDSLYSVEAAWWKDGVGRLSEPGRATSPALSQVTPVRPDPTELIGLGRAAREVVDIVIRVDHDEAESIRGRFDEGEASRLSRLLAGRLPHPSQLACLLHVMMDFAVPELKLACLRLLQLAPTHHMAAQYYADALGMLAAVEGGEWSDAYFHYESDFEAACRQAERRREEAGLEVEFGAHSPFLQT